MDDLNAPQPSGAELVKKLRKKQAKKAKKLVARKTKPKKTKKLVKAKARKPKAAKRAVKKTSGVVAERLDLRLPKSVKAKLTARAKKTHRTITSIVLELLEKAK